MFHSIATDRYCHIRPQTAHCRQETLETTRTGKDSKGLQHKPKIEDLCVWFTRGACGKSYSGNRRFRRLKTELSRVVGEVRNGKAERRQGRQQEIERASR